MGKICPYLPGIVIPEPAWNRVKGYDSCFFQKQVWECASQCNRLKNDNLESEQNHFLDIFTLLQGKIGRDPTKSCFVGNMA